MGEIADMMLDGTLCQRCGCVLDGDTPGYPRFCEDCAEDEIEAEMKQLLEYDFNFNKVGVEKLLEEVMERGTKKQKLAMEKVCYKMADKLRKSAGKQIRL